MIKTAKQLLQVGVLGSVSLLLGCSSGVDDELLSYVRFQYGIDAVLVVLVGE